MLYRNMLAMETEELLRSYPVDGAVLLGGCDKTTPALLMGAASVDLPTVFVPAGPMLPGHWRDEVLGSGTDMWKYWDDKRAGLIGDCEMAELENGLARSPGTLHDHGHRVHPDGGRRGARRHVPGASSIPAVDSGHDRMAAASGLRIVELVLAGLKLSKILTAEAYEDAVATVLALGGSTNAVIHLIAMAGPLRVQLTLDDFDRIARTVPVLANLRPGGKYLMEDFHFAGGLPGVPGPARPTYCTWTGPPSRTPPARTARRALVHNPDVIRAARQPARRGGRRGGAARQPLPRRRGHQAHRRRAAPAAGTPAPPSSSTTTGRCSAPSTTRRSASPPDHVLVLRKARAPRAAPACPSTGCCRSPTTCSSRAYGTWCGSPTPG